MATRGHPGTHVCQHCGRHFRRGAVLKSHLPNCPHRPDVQTSSLSCQFCQRLFNRSCEVSKHQLSSPSRQASAAASEQAEKELACPLCDRRFKRPCQLGRHLQFCKSSRSSATVEPSDDCSSLPCSPRSDASFWNESQMHSINDQASQTPESAPTSATGPLHQHSAGGSEVLQFGPTLGQDEASRSSVRVNEPIRVPSSGCKGYWTNTNAALEAVIEQSCLGLCSSPPEQALRQLCEVIYNFFSQPVPPHRSGTTRQPTSNSTTLRTLH